MTRFEYYKKAILEGDFTAVDAAADDMGLTNGEYCELYEMALELAKKIGC